MPQICGCLLTSFNSIKYDYHRPPVHSDDFRLRFNSIKYDYHLTIVHIVQRKSSVSILSSTIITLFSNFFFHCYLVSILSSTIITDEQSKVYAHLKCFNSIKYDYHSTPHWTASTISICFNSIKYDYHVPWPFDDDSLESFNSIKYDYHQNAQRIADNLHCFNSIKYDYHGETHGQI